MGHPSYIGRLAGIESKFAFMRRPFRYRAEATAAGTKVAENHECRGAARETLVHVRAPRRLAHGVKIQLAQILLQIVDSTEVCRPFTQPLGQARPRSTINLNQGIQLVFSHVGVLEPGRFQAHAHFRGIGGTVQRPDQDPENCGAGTWRDYCMKALFRERLAN